MTQRSPLNDRYNSDNRGKTRKSSASAKPKATRAATLRDPAPKTKKQKRQEQREKAAESQRKAGALQLRYEDTPSYKRYRRLWWIFLIAAIAVTALSVYLNSQGTSYFNENPGGRFLGFLDQNATGTISTVFMVAAYVCIIIAFYLDLGKIRKERKIFNASVATDNSKEARRLQKQALNQQRQQEREAQAAKDEQDATGAQDSAAKGPKAWFSRGKSQAKQAKEDLQAKAAAQKDSQDKD